MSTAYYALFHGLAEFDEAGAVRTGWVFPSPATGGPFADNWLRELLAALGIAATPHGIEPRRPCRARASLPVRAGAKHASTAPRVHIAQPRVGRGVARL